MLIIWHEVDSIAERLWNRKLSSCFKSAKRSSEIFLQLLNSGILLNLSHEDEHLRFESKLQSRRTFILAPLAQPKVHDLMWNVYCVKNYIYSSEVGGECGWRKAVQQCFCYCDVITFHYFCLRYHFSFFIAMKLRDVLAGAEDVKITKQKLLDM